MLDSGADTLQAIREIADRRIRPSTPAGAVVADTAGKKPVCGGPVRQLNRYNHATGVSYQYGCYGRGRYGENHYT
ncbi:MAG: hypothetical protein R6V19_00095 [Armatimonadota bacterium]